MEYKLKEPPKKVWVNGTFDILHYGHIKLLDYASQFGSLKVGVDSDQRVKELKGYDRPFNSVDSRKYILESIKFVNEVVVFGSREEMVELIKNYEPDYMIVGDDYINQPVYGSEYTKKLIFFPRIIEFSTTKILNYYNK